MYTLLVILFVLVSILLMITILMQSSKGGGLASSFGGMGGGAVLGPRGTADFLQKATTVLGILFILLALAINWVGRPKGIAPGSILQEELNRTQQEQGAPANVPVAPLPPGGETQPQNNQ